MEPAADLPSARRGSLFILTEIGGGGPATLYRQMLNAAQTAFYEKGENVEAALKLAVRNVHLVLRQANADQPGARWRAGISLAVRYADQLTIAQAGPGLALVSHPRTVDQFPAEFGAWGAALGGDEPVDVQIYDATVEPNSMILLAQSDWPRYVAPQALAIAAAAPDVTLASQYLGQLAGGAELSAMLIGFSSTIPEVIEPRPYTTTFGRAEAVVETPPEPERGKGILSGVGKLFGVHPDEAVTPTELTPPAPKPVTSRAPVTPPSEAPALRPTAPPMVAPGRPVTSRPTVRPEAGEPLQPLHRPEPAPAEKHVSRPSVRPTAPPAAPIYREPFDSDELEDEEAPPQAEWEEVGVARRKGGLGGRFWLLLSLIVIPLLIVGLVLAMLFYRAQAAQRQFTERLDGARTAIIEAEGLTDEAQIAQRLSGAKDFLDKARATKPDDEELTQLDSRYQALLDKIEKVTPLYGILPMYPFQQPGHSVAHVLVGGDALFVLDRGRGEVNRFQLSQLGDSVTFDKAVVKKGDQLDGKIVGDLLDVAWVEATVPNQRSKVLAMDAANSLVGYDLTWGATRLPLGGSAKLVRPALIASYGGNLYVVDVGASQIWRFRPGANGYEEEPEPYFADGKQVNLNGVQAMAIDGNIWLLFTDGRLLKFFTGDQRPFELHGVPGGISAPTSLAVPLEGDLLYILDAGNGRIVEVTKEGEFMRQFRPRDSAFLRNAKSMYLSETAEKLYLVTPDQLYAADLPAPAEPAPTTDQPAVAPTQTP